jgi:di/tripeptidase
LVNNKIKVDDDILSLLNNIFEVFKISIDEYNYKIKINDSTNLDEIKKIYAKYTKLFKGRDTINLIDPSIACIHIIRTISNKIFEKNIIKKERMSINGIRKNFYFLDKKIIEKELKLYNFRNQNLKEEI